MRKLARILGDQTREDDFRKDDDKFNTGDFIKVDPSDLKEPGYHET